jgi:beta-ribofuranosylaminobenzene 5'-phosphate synthase
MTPIRVRIRAPSRLHFGLLGWNPQSTRQFGGIGLMVESPGVELTAEPATEWAIDGTLAPRVRQVIEHLRIVGHEEGIVLKPLRIRIHTAPPEHVGLGVGTQLSLAVTRSVLYFASVTDPSLDLLARLAGRGARSGIGVHGFYRGGLLVDGGRKPEGGIPPLLCRILFPEEWSVLIVRPDSQRGLHGPDELQAFAALPPIPPEVIDYLCRIVLLGILPAVLERDLPAFGAAVSELNARVGACFAPVQGGPYASPRAPAILAEMTNLGLVGIGQTSWGPSLFGFAPKSDVDSGMIDRIRHRFGLDESAAFWTRGDNRGALVLGAAAN